MLRAIIVVKQLIAVIVHCYRHAHQFRARDLELTESSKLRRFEAVLEISFL